MRPFTSLWLTRKIGVIATKVAFRVVYLPYGGNLFVAGKITRSLGSMRVTIRMGIRFLWEITLSRDG